MSTNFNTCFIDSNGGDVSQEFVEKSYLLDVYPSLINQAKAPALWVWGQNDQGGLGNNTLINASSPVQTISAGTNWKQISSGGNHAAAIKTDGTLWLWGLGTCGQLGDNTGISKSSPVQTISAGTNWKQVAAKGAFTVAVKTDGTLWTWGSAAISGNNTSINRSSPIQTVSGGTNWKSAEVGQHVLSIKTDGTLWSWGFGACGALGNSDVTDRSSPIQTVSGGTNWKQVSAGANFSAAIKTDGTLWLWGFGNSGQLGDNTGLSKSSPVQTVSGGTNWKQVSLGTNHAAAIKTDGTLWLWGRPLNGGNLGDNTMTARSSPIQTVTGGTNWKQVSLGGNGSGTMAIKTDGTLWIWGPGLSLGNNTTINASSPVQTISGGTNWKQASPNDRVSMAIREEGDW
jgi:alpha-tubulin suppressor-like RCC1 family protein